MSRGPHAEIMPLWWLLPEVTVISGKLSYFSTAAESSRHPGPEWSRNTEDVQ